MDRADALAFLVEYAFEFRVASQCAPTRVLFPLFQVTERRIVPELARPAQGIERFLPITRCCRFTRDMVPGSIIGINVILGDQFHQSGRRRLPSDNGDIVDATPLI